MVLRVRLLSPSERVSLPRGTYRLVSRSDRSPSRAARSDTASGVERGEAGEIAFAAVDRDEPFIAADRPVRVRR